MPRKPIRPPRPLSSAVTDPRHKKRATVYDRIMILDWHHAHRSTQVKTARYFQLHGFPHLTQPLMSAWLKDELRIRNQANEDGLNVKRARRVKNPLFDNALRAAVAADQESGRVITDAVIREHGERLYVEMGVPEGKRLRLSNGWLNSFKERSGIRDIRYHERRETSSESEEIRDAQGEEIRDAEGECDEGEVKGEGILYSETLEKQLAAVIAEGITKAGLAGAASLGNS